jgi:uncharacterized protein (DUF305 family)
MLHSLKNATRGGNSFLEASMRFTHVLVLAAGLGLGLLSLGCGQDAPMTPVSPSTTLQPEAKPSGGGTSGTYEISYMESTINHEELIRQCALIAMGKQLDHTDLATFAQNEEATAGQNIATLQSYLSAWYNIQFSPKAPSSRTLDRLASLDGAAFEKAYLNQTVSEDQVRVRDGQRCYSRATHTMLILFGFNIQLDATHEIAQLKSWLCGWFSAC